jgi:F0F1-type ATP synthase delta subunit
MSIENFNILKKLRLLESIFMNIISYTYQVQDKKLIEDIKHNYESKKHIYEIYRNIWIVEMNEVEPEDKEWLINDLYRYANDDIATMLGYIVKFYNIFFRNKYLKTVKDINKYIINLEEEKNIIKEINIFWGLFTIEERNEFISTF